jgi:hypothetical protein
MLLERALSEVVEQQCREDHREPAESDRLQPKMTHVGVQGFRSGDDQNDCAEHQESRGVVARKEARSLPRIDRGQHLGVAQDPADPRQCHADEPDQRNRPEERSQAGGAGSLQHEEPNQDGDCNWNYVWREPRSRDLESFHCAQHADRRRDHAFAVEQCRAENAEGEEDGAPHPWPIPDLVTQQREQRQHPALAAVVGPQNEDEILDDDNQRQRPENQREHAQHVGRSDRDAVSRIKGLTQRIQRTGADVAEDYTECAESEESQALRGSVGRRRWTSGLRVVRVFTRACTRRVIRFRGRGGFCRSLDQNSVVLCEGANTQRCLARGESAIKARGRGRGIRERY